MDTAGILNGPSWLRSMRVPYLPKRCTCSAGSMGAAGSDGTSEDLARDMAEFGPGGVRVKHLNDRSLESLDRGTAEALAEDEAMGEKILDVVLTEGSIDSAYGRLVVVKALACGMAEALGGSMGDVLVGSVAGGRADQATESRGLTSSCCCTLTGCPGCVLEPRLLALCVLV